MVSVGISALDEIVRADNTSALRVHLAVDIAALYWVLGGSFATKSEIRRCALTGTDCTTIATVDGAVRRFLIVGDEFYYDSNVRFYRLKKTVGTPTEVYSPAYADKLTGNSSNLYWYGPNGGGIFAVGVDGQHQRQVLDTTDKVMGIVADESGAYAAVYSATVQKSYVVRLEL